jgi:hypothetical protein
MVLSFADVQSLSIQILFGGKRSTVTGYVMIIEIKNKLMLVLHDIAML